MPFKLKLFSGLLLATLATTSHATVVDFQDVASGSCNWSGSSVQSRGFNFTGNPIDPNLFVCNAGVIQSNTSAALINANSRSVLTMTQVGGGAFSLNSFFAGGRTADLNPNAAVTGYSVATSIDILGTLIGGSTVTTSVLLDSIAPYNWTLYSLSPLFSNLTSVTFTAQGLGATPEFLIDNIVVNQAVPEPASLALLGLGLVGLMQVRRRKSV